MEDHGDVVGVGKDGDARAPEAERKAVDGLTHESDDRFVGLVDAAREVHEEDDVLLTVAIYSRIMRMTVLVLRGLALYSVYTNIIHIGPTTPKIGTGIRLFRKEVPIKTIPSETWNHPSISIVNSDFGGGEITFQSPYYWTVCGRIMEVAVTHNFMVCDDVGYGQIAMTSARKTIVSSNIICC